MADSATASAVNGDQPDQTRDYVRYWGRRIPVVVSRVRGDSLLGKAYKLKIEVVDCPDDLSPNIFVYQRSAKGAPMEDGSPRDEFVNIADELDVDEIPVGEPDLARGIPYYRTSSVELWFRNPDLLRECMHELLENAVNHCTFYHSGPQT